ncbi:hybrid sensor histidine kinase/response regulator [Ramlibacter tataouinensis]|nr:PAS domain-containing protein [Ramlibacter tataouinensis]
MEAPTFAFDDPRLLAGLLVEASADVIFTKDLQGRYRYANPALLQAVGLQAHEVLGRTAEQVLPDAAAARQLMDNDRQVLAHGQPVEVEEAVPSADGGWRHWLTRKTPLRDERGRIIGLLAVAREITERKLAQAQRDLIRLKLEMGVQAAGLVMAEIDYRSNQNHISAELARLFEMGEAAMTVPRQAIFDRIHPEDRPRYLQGIARAIDPAGNGHLAIQVRALLPSGTVKWLDIRLQVTFAPAADGQLQPDRGMCAARDVTSEVLADAALRVSEARFRVAAEAASDILWTNDPSGRMRGPQPGWAAFTGQRQEEYQDYGWARAVHPDDAQPTIAAWNAAVARGSKFVFQHRVRRHDGVWRTFSVRALPVQDADGQVREWVGVHTDITDLLAAGRARSEAERRYRQLFENMTEEVHFWRLEREPDGRIRSWRLLDANGPALATWQRRLDDIRGLTTDEIFGAGATGHYRPVVEQVMREQRPVSYDDFFQPLGRHFRFATVPLGSEEFMTTGADVTAMRTAQQTIERQNLELRDADARKDRFLATLSHELRNPLAPIRTAAELLARPTLAADQLALARQVIQRQVGHMALLLDDLLDVARITQGKLELRRERVALAAIVDSAVEAVRPLIERKQHRLRIELPARALELEADPLRLSQVLANLLTNAAKYTDAGGCITLAAAAEGGLLRLEVRDTGIGLAPEALPGLFRMFSQVREASDRSEGGLGLGLALVRALVELHGGSVAAGSAGPGQGSTFTVRVPLPAATGPSRPDSPATALEQAGRKVLVADDNRDAADTLALLLEADGHQVRVAYDGRTAVSLARAFQPDAALLDIGMPELNGHEVARALRQEPWAQGLVLVAVTGWGQAEDRRIAREAGFDHHVTKPVEPAALDRLLAPARPA